jgi:PPOX class probable F420-dependent enzyme
MPAMTKAEREAFLADVHVGVLSVAREGRAPLTVPVWYSYTPGGEVRVITGAGTPKAQALRTAGRFSFCVQSEAPPYSYVTVEGEVAGMEPVDVERDLRPMARRYLGVEGGDQWLAENGGSAAGQGDVLVVMRPRHWLSADFGKPS